MIKPRIPTPTTDEVRRYLRQWDSLEDYVSQENSLELLFQHAYPENKRIEHILIKVCCLNQFYSTNIYSPFKVAKHILGLDIDQSLATGDLDLVNRIALVEMSEGKERNNYSFASKYCSHHSSSRYPIYDSYVEKVLMHFRGESQFSDFRKGDLRNYEKFAGVLEVFRGFYQLQKFSVKDIDRYLWQVGKEFFRRTF